MLATKRGGEAVLGGPGRSAKTAISRQGKRKNTRYALLCCSVPACPEQKPCSSTMPSMLYMVSPILCRRTGAVSSGSGPARSGSSPRRVGFTKLAANFHRPGGMRAPPRDGVESSRCTVGPSVRLLAATLSRGRKARPTARKRKKMQSALLCTYVTPFHRNRAHAYSSSSIQVSSAPNAAQRTSVPREHQSLDWEQ